MHGLSTLVNACHRLGTYEKGEHGKPHLGDKGSGTSLMIQSRRYLVSHRRGGCSAQACSSSSWRIRRKCRGRKGRQRPGARGLQSLLVYDDVTRWNWLGGKLLQSFPVLAKKNKVPVVPHDSAECMRIYRYCISMSERRCGLLAFCCPPPPHYCVLL